MSFPNLELESGNVLHSKAQGVPDDGLNEFVIGIDPRKIRGREGNLRFRVRPLGTSVVASSEAASLSADRTKATINFYQRGGDECVVTAVFTHSDVR